MRTLKTYESFNKEEEKDSFNFKDLFLRLTEYTVPFGYEEELEPILYEMIPNLQKDPYGNYYVNVGRSKTLFTSHLDTYCKRREKVNHVIKKKKIATDQTTVLGGDNKNGVVILMYMIKNNVPGMYYFFKGEEGIVTGKSCNGSTWLLENDPNIFVKYDRAIAFDRRGRGSIVTKQRARRTCSDEFADALIEEFKENGLPFHKDYAYGTDAAVFMDIIPEVTNISSGGAYEHSYLETTDIGYTEKVAKAAVNIKWEELPVVRDAEPVYTAPPSKAFSKRVQERSKKTFDELVLLMGMKGFNCLNSDKFAPDVPMVFDKFTKDMKIVITVFNDKINVIDDEGGFFNSFKGDTIEELKEYLNIPSEDFMKRVISAIARKMDQSYLINKKDLDEILHRYGVSYDDFKDFIEESSVYSKYFKFYDDKVYMDIEAGQGVTINRQKEQEKKKTAR